jgi:uncharacterized membrane protein SirB2
MTQFYPLIKSVHVAMVAASVCLFALRGAGSLAGHRWPMWRLLRVTTYVIDTTLLAAALLLVAILPWGLFANGWLAMKLGLLLVYIVLGYAALRVRGGLPVRVLLYVTALLVYGWMYTIARAHHPLGILRGLFG